MSGGFRVEFEIEGEKKRAKRKLSLARMRLPKPKKKASKRRKFKLDPVVVKPDQNILKGIHNAWAKGYEQAFRGFFHAPSTSEWAREYFQLVPSATSAAGAFDPTPYQVGILDVAGMLTEGPRKVVFLKSARAGYTTTLLCLCAFFAHAGRNQLFYLPKGEAVNNFGKFKLKETFLRCEPTREMLAEETRASSYGNFMLGGKACLLLGARSPVNLKGHDADTVFIDECDEISLDAGSSVVGTATGKAGQGDSVGMMEARTNNSPFPTILIGSTPTDVGDSIVWREYHDCTIKFAYHVQCPRCGELDPLYWEQFIWDKLDTLDESAESVRYICRLCSKPWKHGKLKTALINGCWMVPQTLTTSLHGDLDEENKSKYVGWRIFTRKDGPPLLLDTKGNKQRWPQEVGFSFWSGYSWFSSWKELVYRWLKAQHTAETRKAFVLQNRGIPWVDARNEIVDSDLNKNRVDLRRLPNKVRFVTAAVDVQSLFLSLLVVGWSVEKHAYVIQQKQFVGDVSDPERGAWQDLRNWLEEDHDCLMREDGMLLDISALAVDSGYKSEIVYNVAGSLVTDSMAVFPIKGRVNDGTQFHNKPSIKRLRDGSGVLLYTIGVGQGKDMLLDMMKNGRVKLNNDEDLVPATVVSELSSERKVHHRANGRNYVRWKKIGSRNNEALDCLNYCLFLVTYFAPDLKSLRPPRVVKSEDIKIVNPGQETTEETEEETEELEIPVPQPYGPQQKFDPTWI